MIETKNLIIGYHSPLLSVEDLNLKPGELYFLIGRNGSGKSTFLQTISAQINAISGAVNIKNQPIESISPSEMPKCISFVSAHFANVDFLRVEDYIALARSPYSNYFGKKTEQDDQMITKNLSILGIAHLKNRFTSELSDGERQMVAIAKAVTQETEIILLDEPTAFLDYANKQLVMQSLSKICKDMNKCIVISSHDIELSIENNGHFLIVDSKNKTLSLHDNGISKEDLLKIAFD